MRIYYIRHGQSMNNALQADTNSREGRVVDPDLTTIGHQQAEVLAGYLYESREFLHIDVLYCSLMQRAIQTSLPLAHVLGLTPHGLCDSHESGGLYLDDLETNEPVGQKGITPEELHAKYPELALPDDLDEDGWWNRPFETHEQRYHRAVRLINELRTRHADHHHVLALISHQGFFSHFFYALLGQSLPPNFWFTLNNASISCIDITGESINPVFINRMMHMPRELWTW